MLWVEAQVLHWVNEDRTSESGGSFTGIIGIPSEEASEGVAPWAIEGRRSVHAPVVRSLGDVAVTGQGASQLGISDGEPETEPVARQLGDVAVTGQGTSQLGNGDGEPETEPVTR